MYSKIMVPVDLAHLDRLERALETAAVLSQQWGIPVVYVGVTVNTPTEIAHTPEEFAGKLKAFAEKDAAGRGIADAQSKSYSSHDPTVDLDDTLMAAARDTGSDLIVVGSHQPGMREHVFASVAGYLAQHAPVSVMVVR